MSDIRVTSTGKIFYRVDPLLAGILCEAFPAAFELCAQAQPPTGSTRVHAQPDDSPQIASYDTPVFNVSLSATGIPGIYIKYGKTVQTYTGTVEGATAAFKSIGAELPSEILEQYRGAKARAEAPARERA